MFFFDDALAREDTLEGLIDNLGLTRVFLGESESSESIVIATEVSKETKKKFSVLFPHTSY
jgi:hypothetical protein